MDEPRAQAGAPRVRPARRRTGRAARRCRDRPELVGHGEVGADAVEHELVARVAWATTSTTRVGGGAAHPVHPGVDLQVDGQRRGAGGLDDRLGQRVDAGRAVYTIGVSSLRHELPRSPAPAAPTGPGRARRSPPAERRRPPRRAPRRARSRPPRAPPVPTGTAPWPYAVGLDDREHARRTPRRSASSRCCARTAPRSTPPRRAALAQRRAVMAPSRASGEEPDEVAAGDDAHELPSVDDGHVRDVAARA